jgi:NADH dehydrogenase FAD-containing subunit
MIFDEVGKLHMDAIPGSEHILECDTVVFATGQEIDPRLVSNVDGIVLTKRLTISTHPETMATGLRGVFAAGDATAGPSSIIEAIAAARQVTVAIDKYLGGKGVIDETLAPPEESISLPKVEEEERHRVKMPTQSISERLASFDKVELGFAEAMAIEEASRCLMCDLEED